MLANVGIESVKANIIFGTAMAITVYMNRNSAERKRNCGTEKLKRLLAIIMI